MNLTDFFKIQSKCPFCDSLLVTSFLPNRKQTIRYEDDRLLIVYDMKGIDRGNNYKVGYSFGMQDNSFHIEFFNSAGQADYYNEAPLHLIEKFYEFHKNLGALYSFNRQCRFCFRYNSGSKAFQLNFRTMQLDNPNTIELGYESFGFVMSDSQSVGAEQAKIMILHNQYYGNESHPVPRSTLHYWKGHADTVRYDRPFLSAYLSKQFITLPLVPFVSEKETARRLNNLIIFS